MKNNFDIDIFIKEFNDQTEIVGGKFGHNCEFDFLSEFKKLIHHGAIIKIIDYYTISIYCFDKRFDILLFVLTHLPGASRCNWDYKTNQLTLEWHY